MGFLMRPLFWCRQRLPPQTWAWAGKGASYLLASHQLLPNLETGSPPRV